MIQRSVQQVAFLQHEKPSAARLTFEIRPSLSTATRPSTMLASIACIFPFSLEKPSHKLFALSMRNHSP